MRKLVLVNSLSPGDILMMTIAIRSLHKHHPSKYFTDVRSPCNEIFQNSPYITPIRHPNQQREREIIEELKSDLNHDPIVDKDITFFISHYPEIHRSSVTGSHFSDGHRLFLEKQLGIDIPATGMKPDLFFSGAELKRDIFKEKNVSINTDKFWIINAGIKSDYTLKFYSHYQEVVDMLRGKITFVQIGNIHHRHDRLDGVVDMRGKTNLREAFLLMNAAQGILTCVSMPMVVASALDKPCVVVAGAREGVRWQLNPNHRYLYTNGCLPCAPYDGCWKSKIEDCVAREENGQPRCMEMISPQMIVEAIQMYYKGGVLEDGPGTGKAVSQLHGIGSENNSGECGSGDHEKNRTSDEVAKFVDCTQKSIDLSLSEIKQVFTACIFNTLRILKRNNPDDQYLEAYKWHYEKRGLDFMDSYHIMWWIGANFAPQSILEIGCRTGISICQLLSSYVDHSVIRKVVLCDPFLEQGSPEEVIGNLMDLNIPVDNVDIIEGDSMIEIPKMISEVHPGAANIESSQFDYILVDGNHDKEYARKDLRHSAVLIAPGGFILFDDITEDGCSLQDVWDEFKLSHVNNFDFMEDHNGKGIGVARRKFS